MDPTCGLVEKVRDFVLSLIREQLLYLIHYHTNIEQLNEQLEVLALKRSSIQHRIDEATNNAENIEEEVLRWLLQVDKISEQVQRLHQEIQANKECSITSCPNPLLRSKLSKRAEAMAQRVVEICRNGNFNAVSYRVPPPPMQGLTNTESNEGIDSRVPIMDQIMEALRNPSVNMIGLCGLGGVGKTTIAKEVATNQNIFEKVIMATVSKELNVKKIQGQIAEKLGMRLNEETEDVRASHLHKRLQQEKNTLLILDDLWEEIDLGKVGIPFVDVEKNGSWNHQKKKEEWKLESPEKKKNGSCKILLTSRNDVLLSNLMKCQNVIKVGVLSDTEAFELFKRIAELSIHSSHELISIATNIVRKFEGLPLAIATTAKALRSRDLDEWKDASERLNNPLRRNTTLTKEMDGILKLSYDHLSSPEYKNIFLLAAMLSHDPSIEDLLMYSAGLDFLEGIKNMEDAHVGISTIVRKLKSSNLFLDSFSSHHVTIHDVFRDIALSIASSELHAFTVRHRTLNEWPDEGMVEDYKGICLQESDISVDLPEELHGPRLKFFLLSSTNLDLTIPSMFFKSSKELKVLAFTKVHFSSLPSLIFLQKLKTLCLHSCLLEDISEVRRLKNLKVLSLAYSEIQQLPIELAELTSLQMLNLAHCTKLKVIPPKLLSSFQKLEVLHMGNSFDQWKVEGSSKANENASLDELKDLPISSLDIHIPNISILPENLFLDMNLKRYKIFIGKRWKWQGNYESSKILKLELQSSIHLKCGVQKLFEGVEELYLYGPNGLENILHRHDGRGFPYLRYLRIESEDIKYIVLNSVHHETAANNVSNKILESIFRKKVILLPKLEKLKLSNLVNSLIPLIWDGQLPCNSFCNLKTLIVKCCGFVKLVPLHVLKSLYNLEELKIEDCGMLTTVFDFEDLNEYKEMDSSSVVVPLKRLELWSLPKLKNVWSDHYQGNVSFPSLRRVVISYCESLTSIFPASIAKCMLRDLEELQISNCDIDVIVAKDQISESVDAAFEFPKLTFLRLSWLRNLRNFYPYKHTLEWPHLQQLSIEFCHELEIFKKEVSSSSEILEEESALDLTYPLLSHNDKVVHNLEELKLQGKQAEMIGCGHFPMYHFPKVKLLHLYVKKSTTVSYKSLLKNFPNLRELALKGDFKEALGGEDVTTLGGEDVTALSAPFLKLTLNSISSTGSLSPFLVSSPNLTHLEVTFSDGLTTLMTSSTAQSLVHLTHLSIRYCHQIEEIITKQEGEDDKDKEIFFSKLEILELIDLPSLKRFCSRNYTFKFPLLDQVIITGCPKFKIFSPGLIDTPSLKSIQLSQHLWGQHHEIWDTNLYKTFYQQRFVKSREVVLDEDDLSMIRNDQFQVDHFPEVEILGIEGFVGEGVTFVYTLLERFPQLKALHVKDSSFDEEIFSSHNAHIVDQIHQLHVENSSNLIKSTAFSTSFHNLTVLKVSRCHQLIYLMTNPTAKSLVNLETLEIYDCTKMEEIVKNETNEDIEEGITFNALRILKLTHLPRLKIEEDTRDFNVEDRATNTRCRKIFRPLFSHHKVLFSKLEVLKLSNLNSLIPLIWDDQLSHNSFSNLKTLTVESCGFLKMVPLHVLKSLNNLEEFKVENCDLLEMVFDFEDLNDYKEKELSSLVMPLKKLKLQKLPKLKNVWSNHSQGTLSLAPSVVSAANLTHLQVACCDGLTTLMTSSVARSLVCLTHLSIHYCDQINEIITKLEGEDDDEDKEISLSKLEFLELSDLPRLKRFCGYNYTFKFPLLEHVTITECPQLTTFCLGTILAPRLQSVQVDRYGPHKNIWMTNLSDTIQHRFTIEEVISTTLSMALNDKNITTITDVFPEVCDLYVEGFSDDWVTFPYNFLERFPDLDRLFVEHCSFEEIFPSQDHIIDFMGKIPSFRGLFITNLDNLKGIWKDDSQLPPIHQDLACLKVNSCYNLVKLAPSSASFQNLSELSICRCHQLIYLVTSSAAKSLVSLRRLEINDCNKMEEIVMNETNENVEGGITFNLLSLIKLTNMQCLKTFSSQSHTFGLPELEEIQITGCHEMKMLCPGVLKTPKLSKVKIEEHDMEWKEKGDLNKTIETLTSAKDSVYIEG